MLLLQRLKLPLGLLELGAYLGGLGLGFLQRLLTGLVRGLQGLDQGLLLVEGFEVLLMLLLHLLEFTLQRLQLVLQLLLQRHFGFG